jgi:hypothetical protein
MHVKYRQDNLHRMTWYTSTYGIMAMCLQYMLVLWSNLYVLYGPWIQWLFVAGIALMGSHYRMDIISGVSHPRSDSVLLLVLCIVVYNGYTSIVLQVHQNRANPIEKG